MTNQEFFSASIVKYPSREEAMAFCDPESCPFSTVLIGMTAPTADYAIIRDANAGIYDMEYVLEGAGELILENGTRCTAQAGDTYLLAAGEVQQYRSVPERPFRKIWINFTCDHMGAMLRAYRLTSGVYHADTRSHFETLLHLSQSARPYAELRYLIAEQVYNIVHALSMSLANRYSDAERIKYALRAAVYQKRSLDQIAAELHMSKSNLIRVFRTKFGTTPYDYLLAEKINTARLLLRNTRMPIKEIAQKLCISDEHYFSSLFFARCGMRPGEYRVYDTTKKEEST